MVRISNGLISILNLVTLVLSISIIGAAVHFRLNGHTECQQFLQTPLLIIGAGLFVISIIGFFGSCRHVTSLLCVYLFFLSLLIIGLFCFTIFVFVVTNKGVGQVVSGRGFKEYRLGDYSNWLQKHFVNGQHWDQIRSCLVDIQVCKHLGNDRDVAEFYKKHLSSIQSGCCKPPIYCGLIFKNATVWEMPKTGPEVPDSDCTTWSNDQDKLCYDCKSCKGGVLDNLKQDWKKLAILNIVILIFVLIVNCIGSCAYGNSKERRYNKGYGGYYH